MAQLEETFTCCTCKEIKSISFMLKHKKRKQCKACGCKQGRKTVNKYRVANRSANWVRPTLSRCYKCKKTMKGTYFAMRAASPNGLHGLCKYHQTIRNCQATKRQMELDRVEFLNLLDTPCYYCGGVENVGVDRIFNHEGYFKENCVSCCWKCNELKGKSDVGEFLYQVEKIYEYRVKKLLLEIKSNQSSIEPKD